MNLRSLLPLAFALVAVSAHAQYAFNPIDADSGDGSRVLSGAPALNDAGQVAYRGSVDGDAVVFRHSGGVNSVVAGPADGLGFIGFFPTINASGTVGFAANGSRIYRTTPGGVQEVGGAGFDFVDFFPSINVTGSVAFRGERLPGFVDGVYVADGTSVTAVYDETGPYDAFGSAPSLNASGFVASTARRDADGEGVLLLGNGANPTVIADTLGELSFINDLVDLNDAGDVAFFASLDDGSSALYRWRGGALTTLADSSGDLSGFGTLAMNASGDVAFVGNLDDGSVGLFAPGAANPLLVSGATFLGKTLFGFGLSRDGLNASGGIAFMAYFDDGSSSLILANPVPEPAMLLALGAGAAALLRRRKR